MTYPFDLKALRLALVACVLSAAPISMAWAETVVAHGRPRPPELVVDNGVISGPLRDILDEAAAKVGLNLTWENVPFPRSLQDLQSGRDVIVPRVRRIQDREPYILFLGPIAVQKREVAFLGLKGKAVVTKYEDLAALTIGVKRGTTYFERFNTDKALRKIESTDDQTLVSMLLAGRFDVIATVDRASLDSVLKADKVTDAVYSPYAEAIDGENHYAIARNGGLAKRAAELDAIFKNMAATGRVREIYGKYNLNPEQIE